MGAEANDCVNEKKQINIKGDIGSKHQKFVIFENP